MSPLADLWLPILGASVAVFVASFLAWMVLPHHKKDIRPLPDETALTSHLETLRIPPGMYMWPNCQTAAEMKSEEFKQRFERGPWGTITVIGAKPNFARNLVLTFVIYLVISIFVAYLTSHARGAGADFSSVFQVAGCAAILGYCLGGLSSAVFLGHPVRFILTNVIDSVVYGLITGLVFAWLWPAAG